MFLGKYAPDIRVGQTGIGFNQIGYVIDHPAIV
jgi:hypothetical protein